MRWMLLFLIGCGKPGGGITVNVSDTTVEATRGDGLVAIDGATISLGETDPQWLSDYAGGDGDRQTIIPEAEFSVAPFLIDRFPFPGVEGAAWFSDGAHHSTVEALDATLADFGRRACTITELLFAAASADNHRYPYGDEFVAERCEPDDVNPDFIGTYSSCHSALGIHDFGVRSTWGRLDSQIVSVMSETDQGGSFPGELSYASWGGTSRDDTFYAPTNFGFHTHAKEGEDRYLDDGFRICADTAPTRNEDLAFARWLDRALEAGSFEALFD
jgi:hypothetical protein